MNFPLNPAEAATILSNMASPENSNCCTQQQSLGSNFNSAYLSTFDCTSSDSNRLSSVVDSILLAKKQTVDLSHLFQDQQHATENSVMDEEASELNDCIQFFAHNDSSELIRSCTKKRRHDADEYIELTPPGDRRVTFDLPSTSNQNLSEPTSADGQFMSYLIPLLEQVPPERKARIRDQLYRILVGELQASLQTPLLSPPQEPSTWSPMISLVNQQSLVQSKRTRPLPSLSVINSHDGLLFGDGNDVCRLTQSTPLHIGPAHNDLAIHFPLTESMHWSLEQFSNTFSNT